jgi:ribosomal protein S27E
MIYYFAAVLAGTRKALERECPDCHHKQTVALSQREISVPCEECNALIPPRKDPS